ncbi:MAG: hypothetical protein GTN76_03195 [Candidatus Aenigmarchaeota archaeon]|nr:hypothetical protein [Candidatus Aenigmarchaeota archaeon]
MVVKGWAFEVIKENPHIDKIIIFNPSWTVPDQEGTQTAGIRGIWELIFRLRREHCDLAIDFKGDPRNILIAYLSGAKRRISYAIRGGGFLLTDIVPYEPGIHEIDKNLKLLTPLGIHSEDSHMELFINGEDKTMVEQTFAQEGIDLNRKTIALHYGGASRYKRWDMEKFITLAQRLTENNLTNVLMFGGPYEKTSQLGEKSGQSIFTMPGMTICQMAAAFKKCDLLVCNDSGPMHIGLAVGIPTVAIFGPTFADRFGPKDLEKNRVIYSKRPCSPCWHPDKAIGCVKRDCFQSIEVESVLAAVNELSNGTSR